MIRTAGVTNYPVSNHVTFADYRTKEALKALVMAKTVEFNKCQGCLETNPDIGTCTTCLQKMLKKRLCR